MRNGSAPGLDASRRYTGVVLQNILACYKVSVHELFSILPHGRDSKTDTETRFDEPYPLPQGFYERQTH